LILFISQLANGYKNPTVVGIAVENQSRMFNEFMQFNRNTLQGGGGSGLGLWICKNLATLHGGRLVRRYYILECYTLTYFHTTLH